VNNVLWNKTDVAIVGPETLRMLKRMAEHHPKKRSRICLHRDNESPVQEMVIAAHVSSYVRPHKHNEGRTESYHMLEGIMRVNLYHDDGRPRQVILLNKFRPMYRLNGGIYHEPVSVSEWVVYHEVFCGPFDKERDVLYAPWSATETA